MSKDYLTLAPPVKGKEVSREGCPAWLPGGPSLAHSTLETLVCYMIPMLQMRTIKIRMIEERSSGHQLVYHPKLANDLGVEIYIQVPDSRLWVLGFVFCFFSLHPAEDCSRSLLIGHF